MLNKTRRILIFFLITCSGCLNINTSKNETPRVCGVVDDEKTKITQLLVFKAKCATCHSYKKDLTGPKMSGVLDRVPSEEWLKQFITNQDSLIKVRDEYTLEIIKESKVEWSHNFKELEENELEELLEYISH